MSARIVENTLFSLVEYYRADLIAIDFETIDSFPGNDIKPDTVAINISRYTNTPLELGDTCDLKIFDMNLDIWATSKQKRDDAAAVLFDLSLPHRILDLQDFSDPSVPVVIGNLQFDVDPVYKPLIEEDRGQFGQFRGILDITVKVWFGNTGP